MQPSESGTRKDLVFHRIETAKEDLNAAKILREAKVYKGANNRAYYAVFHAICAVYALTGTATRGIRMRLEILIKKMLKLIFSQERWEEELLE